MFHIPKDKRSKASAHAILNALLACLKQANFNQISVTQICQKADISRTTFYRLFDNPTDIIYWSTDCRSKELCQSFLATGRADKEWPFHFSLRYIFEHSDVLELAILANRIDIANEAFQRNISSIMENMRLRYGVTKEDWIYSSSLTSSIIVSTFQTWMNSDKKEDLEIVYERVRRIIAHLQ